MALIKCKECGHNVSSRATQCPACGAPLKRVAPKPGCFETLVGLAFIFILFCVGLSLLHSRDAPSGAEAESSQTEPERMSKGDGHANKQVASSAENWKSDAADVADYYKREELKEIGPGDGRLVTAPCKRDGDDPKLAPAYICRPITETLLKSLMGMTREQVVAIMGASGYVEGRDMLYLDNYVNGDPDYHYGDAGNVSVDFENGKVVIVAASITAADGEFRQFEWEQGASWLRDRYCSQFPGSEKNCW